MASLWVIIGVLALWNVYLTGSLSLCKARWKVVQNDAYEALRKSKALADKAEETLKEAVETRKYCNYTADLVKAYKNEARTVARDTAKYEFKELSGKINATEQTTKVYIDLTKDTIELLRSGDFITDKVVVRLIEEINKRQLTKNPNG